MLGTGRLPGVVASTDYTQFTVPQLPGRNCPHSVDEEFGAQKGSRDVPQGLPLAMAEAGANPGPLIPEPALFSL